MFTSAALLCIDADTAVSMQALSAGACALAVDPEPDSESAAGWALRPASAVMSRSRPLRGVAASEPADAATASSSASDSVTASAAKRTAPGQSDPAAVSSSSAAASEPPWHLFAFPLESNFSGVRYDEGLGNAAAAELNKSPAAGASEAGDDAREGCAVGPRPRRGRWAVLLDAAKACGSRPPDLSKNPVDFVVRGNVLLDCLYARQVHHPGMPLPCREGFDVNIQQ